MTEQRNGIRVGTSAIAILRDHAGDIDQATARLSHITATKEELLEALAYAACQVAAYRRIANEDAALALTQVCAVLDTYKERRRNEADA